MPPLASSKRPTFCAIAPVNAPFSWPNSSLSSRPVGIAAQFSLTNVRALRPLRLWIARAISSLPVPVSPWMSTVESVGATISTCWSTCCSARALADDLLEVVVRPDLLFEVELLRAQLLLELGDLLVREAVLDGDRDLLRHLAEQLDFFVRERRVASRARR